jgi:LEA14-like dessication related protein
MRKLIQGFSFVLLVSSCAVTAPEIRGGESFNIEQIEGNKVNLNVGANIYNGNWFGIRVKPSNLNLFLNDDFLGTVRLDKKVKLKRKSETAIDANLTAILENGAIGKAMRSALGGGLNVRMKGRVKAGVFIFSKKIDFDETKKIDASELRP